LGAPETNFEEDGLLLTTLSEYSHPPDAADCTEDTDTTSHPFLSLPRLLSALPFVKWFVLSQVSLPPVVDALGATERFGSFGLPGLFLRGVYFVAESDDLPSGARRRAGEPRHGKRIKTCWSYIQ
jgi:hypothetical protein